MFTVVLPSTAPGMAMSENSISQHSNGHKEAMNSIKKTQRLIEIIRQPVLKDDTVYMEDLVATTSVNPDSNDTIEDSSPSLSYVYSVSLLLAAASAAKRTGGVADKKAKKQKVSDNK
jgi:hypothetical protein